MDTGTNGSLMAALRAQIDTVDDDLVAVLARRFAVTRQVGRIKATAGLPARDARREAAERDRMCDLARREGVDPDLVGQVFDLVAAQAVAEHEQAAREALGSAGPVVAKG